MRDDITPIEDHPLNKLTTLLEEFRAQPSNRARFQELRDQFHDSGYSGLTAQLLETYGSATHDPVAAGEALIEAAQIRSQLNEKSQAENNLRALLEIAPGSVTALESLADLLASDERWAEKVEALERLVSLCNDDDHLAYLHGECARLWQFELDRLDRALDHWLAAWHLRPDDCEPLVAARNVYAALGDAAATARLFESEIDVHNRFGRDRQRADAEFLLGCFLRRQADPSAIDHFEAALALHPDFTAAKQALADTCASDPFCQNDANRRRGGDLLRELATMPDYADPEQQVDLLRQASRLVPNDPDVQQQLESCLLNLGKHRELDEFYKSRISTTQPPFNIELLQRRAQLHQHHTNDLEKYVESVEELHRAAPDDLRWSEALQRIYEEREQWRKLAALILAEITNQPHDTTRIVSRLLHLATLHERLEQPDEAAHCFHRVLSLDSHNAEALSRYADYFRGRRDWRALCDLHEFAVDIATANTRDADSALRRLEEIAELSETRLGDLERSIMTWERIERLAPNHPRASESLRRLHARVKMLRSLVDVLEHEANGANTPDEHCDALRRLAQVYRERQINPRYAISLYEKILELRPDDASALKSVAELYERDSDLAGLAYTMRRRLALEDRELRAPGPNNMVSSAREWPITKRTERLKALRRLATMYSGPLNDVEGTVFVCGGILEILPGDRDALDKMETMLERVGDVHRLEQTLEYHAAASTAPAERARVFRQLAKLGAARGDFLTAQDRWEQVIQSTPYDGEALRELSTLYIRHERWANLADILERRIDSPEAVRSGPERLALLRDYARTVDRALSDDNRALTAWLRVTDEAADDIEALTHVARLQERCQQWDDHCESLEHLIDLYRHSDVAAAAHLARQRAVVLEQRLGSPAQAATALEQLLELDPRDLEAHRHLRFLHGTSGDYRAAMRVAERELLLCTDDSERVRLAYETAVIYRDVLRSPARALQTLRRVIEWCPGHLQAREDTIDLLATLRRWPQYIDSLREAIDREDTPRRRNILMTKIATCYAAELGRPEEALRWLRLAHEEEPGDATLRTLTHLAETHGLWQELATVYQQELEGEKSVSDTLGITWKLAALQESRLEDVDGAALTLLTTFERHPHNQEILAGIERLANTHRGRRQWEALASALGISAEVNPVAARCELRLQRAHILENKLGDVEAAAEELLRAFSIQPKESTVRAALVELAERTGRWNDVLAAETALAERATATAERIHCLQRKAEVIERKIGDKARAFRTYLSAFLLDPNDQQTLTSLWRLANEIGQYNESEQQPRPEPLAAYVDETASADVVQRAPLFAVRPPHARLPTEELSGDVVLDGDESNRNVSVASLENGSRADPTTQLEVGDLIDLRVRREHTMVLRTEDLIETLGAEAVPRAPERPTVRPGVPPPPPGRRTPPQAPAGTAQATKAIRRRSPLVTVPPGAIPTLPPKNYGSPWLELATAYGLLRAGDPETKLKWLFLTTDVWELGARDIDRALETLAQALALAPTDARVRERAHSIAAAHDKWDPLCVIYLEAADLAPTGTTTVELLHELAAIRTRQAKTDDSETIYRRILGMRPDDQLARERLEELYRLSGRWVDLAASLEERTDPRLGATTPTHEQPALLRELIELYRSKLNHPHDAIEAAKRLLKFDSTVFEAQQLLASLYQQAGRWREYVQVQQELVDANPDPVTAKVALRDVARVYEKELGLTDRAIEAYRDVLNRWPADRATQTDLERLYAAQHNWSELDEILRLRIETSDRNEERLQLLTRRGSALLEHLNAPKQAAECLEAARAIDPEDGELADLVVSALVADGQHSRAVDVLQERIHRDQATAAPGDMAALLVRLASIFASHHDIKRAKDALCEALEFVPNHPSALAELARLADDQKDPSEYGRAKLREAEALMDVDEKIEALLAAGAALRTSDEIDDARDAYRRVLELRPYHPAATWSLASMVEEAGDFDEAIHILQTRLELDTIGDEERAEIYTQLAALSLHAGITSAAEERLQQALALVPSHQGAILGLADLYENAAEWSRLEGFLGEVLVTQKFRDTGVHAELLRRYAAAADGCGKPDEAYQRLIEADRLQRNDLRIKLALGENRYRARRWREAVLHLSTLGQHPQAQFHPGDVAAGLHHAALAEIRSRRPERAESLYLAALDLKPDFAPSLHALADLELERGSTERAAELLTRRANATVDPRERRRLFEALGDMWHEQIHDAEKAAHCYQAAINAATPVDATHVALLRKLLSLQRELRDNASLGRTSELLSSFVKSDDERFQLLLGGAQAYRSAGLNELAKEAAKRAVEIRPFDLQATAVASEILEATDDYDDVATMLGSALNHEQEADTSRALEALLWSRLAYARYQRGDAKGAKTACNKSLSLAPESDGALRARRILLRIWGSDAEQDHVALEYRRVLAADGLALSDIVDYGRALCARQNSDGGRCVLELAAHLGYDLTRQDVDFLGRHPGVVMSDDQSYPGSIDNDDRCAAIADADDEPMASIVTALSAAIPLLWNNAEQVLVMNGYVDVERVSAASQAGAVAIFTRISNALQTPSTLIYRCHAEDAPDVKVLCCAPPVVVLGPRLFAKSHAAASDVELRFLLARAAESTRNERLLALGMSSQQFHDLITSAVRLFAGRPAETPTAQDENLRAKLPVRVRQQLSEQLSRNAYLDPGKFVLACERAADRAGLVIGGDFATAARAIEAAERPDPSIRHLVKLVLTPDFLRLRTKLKPSVQ